MAIDWIKVSDELFRGGVDIVVGGISGYLVYRFKKRREIRKEAILLDLAQMRQQAVTLRNEGERQDLQENNLQEWGLRVRKLEEKIITKAKAFSLVEGTRLETLDRVQVLSYSHIKNSEQIQILQNFSERIKRVDQLIDKHHPPEN